MNKVTAIIGPQGSGKTTKAQELVQGRKSVWLDSLRIPQREILVDTDVIVFDGLAVNRHTASQIKYLCSMEKVTFRQPYSEFVETRDMPDIILITNSVKKDELPVARIDEIIELT